VTTKFVATERLAGAYFSSSLATRSCRAFHSTRVSHAGFSGIGSSSSSFSSLAAERKPRSQCRPPGRSSRALNITMTGAIRVLPAGCLLLAVSLVLVAFAARDDTFEAAVVRVVDGDSLIVLLNGNKSGSA
jgi:hypothetical protein